MQTAVERTARRFRFEDVPSTDPPTSGKDTQTTTNTMDHETQKQLLQTLQ